MFRAYKYRLYPTEAQKVLIAKTFGCCRYVYNKALALKMETYAKEEKTLTVFALDRMMTDWKKTEEEKWLNEVNAQSLQASLRNMDAAYTSFFKKIGRFPRFKEKGNRNSFGNPQQVYVDFLKNTISIPKFREGIKCRLHRKFQGKIKNATISQTPSGKYYVSFTIDESFPNPNSAPPKKERTLGIDLGINKFATFSDGNKITNPRHLSKKAKRLKRAQKQMDRKKKGSKNREKQRIKVAKLHEGISNSRKDFLHKLTHSLVENQNYDSFAIEDLGIKDMMEKGNKDRARNIGDVSWFKFRKFLEYKSLRKGKNVIVIGRFDPSSRLCNCGYHNSLLTLDQRHWTCPACGETHDRDILAARNIVKFAFLRQETAKDSPESSVESPELLTCEISETRDGVSNLGSERPDCLSQNSLKASPKKRNKKSKMPVEGCKTRLKQEISQKSVQ